MKDLHTAMEEVIAARETFQKNHAQRKAISSDAMADLGKMITGCSNLVSLDSLFDSKDADISARQQQTSDVLDRLLGDLQK